MYNIYINNTGNIYRYIKFIYLTYCYTRRSNVKCRARRSNASHATSHRTLSRTYFREEGRRNVQGKNTNFYSTAIV